VPVKLPGTRGRKNIFAKPNRDSVSIRRQTESLSCSISFINAGFILQVTNDLYELTGGERAAYQVNNSSSTLSISYSPLYFPSGLAAWVQQEWDQYVSQSYCNIGTLLSYSNEYCALPGGDPPPGSGNPPSPQDPCVQKKYINSRTIDPTIHQQETALLSAVNSSPNEVGTEQVLSSWNTPTQQTINRPLRSDGSPNSVAGWFTWNPSAGYTIGFMHDHPNGTGPSASDVFELIQNLSNSELVNAGPDAIQFYKDNATITIVTKDNIYNVGVRDWDGLQNMYNASQQNPAYYDNLLEQLSTKFDSYEAAFVELLGSTVTLYTTDWTDPTLEAIPLQQTADHHPAEIPCNN
jgi:hypothetical protein